MQPTGNQQPTLLSGWSLFLFSVMGSGTTEIQRYVQLLQHHCKLYRSDNRLQIELIYMGVVLNEKMSKCQYPIHCKSTFYHDVLNQQNRLLLLITNVDVRQTI